MKLQSLNKYISFLIFTLIIYLPCNGEEAVDIWKKESNKTEAKDLKKENESNQNSSSININKKNLEEGIEISDTVFKTTLENKIFGIFEPEENNFNLTMWSKTDKKELIEILKRIEKIKLSRSAEDIFINTLMTYSYLPANMSEKDFLDIKINWLIKNKKNNLLENFLNKNEDFHGKKKVIQYLIDRNIANYKLKEGCEKANFISKDIRDSYLEKFKIYCLIFNNKKNQAQLLFDILKEQGLSDKFFNNKINFLLGISNKNDNKVKEDNLLNFYLSSITNTDFKYEPNKKTKPIIWEYLNSANLISLENIEDKEKIKNLEIAANENTFNKLKIFEIYTKIPFDLNTLINAESEVQNLDGFESRALIYQKFLLSDKLENKINLLIRLKELFKKDNLSNIYTVFLSDKLKELTKDSIPDGYEKVVEKNIISEVEFKLGKIKYDDKVLHRSRVIRFYTEPGTSKQKSQKDLNNVYKKIKRDRKYFFSAKDIALFEALRNDGFEIPKDINLKQMSENYSVPENLVNLAKNGESAFLSLKFVEIIGQDEISDLDPETIYFITNILNQAKLFKLRNKILISALPLRT